MLYEEIRSAFAHWIAKVGIGQCTIVSVEEKLKNFDFLALSTNQLLRFSCAANQQLEHVVWPETFLLGYSFSVALLVLSHPYGFSVSLHLGSSKIDPLGYCSNLFLEPWLFD